MKARVEMDKGNGWGTRPHERDKSKESILRLKVDERTQVWTETGMSRAKMIFKLRCYKELQEFISKQIGRNVVYSRMPWLKKNKPKPYDPICLVKDHASQFYGCNALFNISAGFQGGKLLKQLVYSHSPDSFCGPNGLAPPDHIAAWCTAKTTDSTSIDQHNNLFSTSYSISVVNNFKDRQLYPALLAFQSSRVM
ncbi:hypothetical protein F4604DRAFT_1673870 [Suillus subluteus]|nr:hypothetical protein F4604DRAFT_1673870 [Suillus subluteus]